jgi:hypothetical protein
MIDTVKQRRLRCNCGPFHGLFCPIMLVFQFEKSSFPVKMTSPGSTTSSPFVPPDEITIEVAPSLFERNYSVSGFICLYFIASM